MELQYFHIRNSHFKYETGTCSRLKYLIQMRNELVQTITFKTSAYERCLSQMKLKQFHLKIIKY